MAENKIQRIPDPAGWLASLDENNDGALTREEAAAAVARTSSPGADATFWMSYEVGLASPMLKQDKKLADERYLAEQIALIGRDNWADRFDQAGFRAAAKKCGVTKPLVEQVLKLATSRKPGTIYYEQQAPTPRNLHKDFDLNKVCDVTVSTAVIGDKPRYWVGYTTSDNKSLVLAFDADVTNLSEVHLAYEGLKPAKDQCEASWELINVLLRTLHKHVRKHKLTDAEVLPVSRETKTSGISKGKSEIVGVAPGAHIQAPVAVIEQQLAKYEPIFAILGRMALPSKPPDEKR